MKTDDLMPMKITFGDYYDDGHGKYTTLGMMCNRNHQELYALEDAAEKLTGYRFQTNSGNKTVAICNEYEDSIVPDKVIEDLVNQGFVNDVVVEEYDDNGNVEFAQLFPLHELENGIEDFAEFFMRWLRMADPELKWAWTVDKSPHAIFNCRGYGLYW